MQIWTFLGAVFIHDIQKKYSGFLNFTDLYHSVLCGGCNDIQSFPERLGVLIECSVISQIDPIDSHMNIVNTDPNSQFNTTL